MKRAVVLLALILVLVIFPLLTTSAFADFIGTGALSVNLLSEPLYMVIFGATLMALGSSLRRI